MHKLSHGKGEGVNDFVTMILKHQFLQSETKRELYSKSIQNFNCVTSYMNELYKRKPNFLDLAPLSVLHQLLKQLQR